MIDPQYLNALRNICQRLQDERLIWVVTGSLGMALQGVDVEVHDIDLQTDKDGAYEIESRFSEFVVKPVRDSVAERIRSHFGLLEIDGIKVEIMGEVRKRMEDQTWEEPVDVPRHRRWVEMEKMRVPVLSLEYECDAYLKLGRSEKADMLRKWLDGAKAG